MPKANCQIQLEELQGSNVGALTGNFVSPSKRVISAKCSNGGLTRGSNQRER